MRAYRIEFDLSSPCLTPWQADTLFGHLCWQLVRTEGERALHRLLDKCRLGEPPLVLSDGFPPDAFPRPMLPPERTGSAGTRAERIAAARAGKSERERLWLTAEDFGRALRGEPAAGNGYVENDAPFMTLHNQIDRRGVTGEEGAGTLHPNTGFIARRRHVYARVAEDIDFDWQTLFRSLVEGGFGKRKSIGYGAIARCEIKEHSGFGEPADPDGFVSLSAFVPAAADPTDGYWRMDVKYGKLGEERANLDNPFKLPLARLLAGSTFRTHTPPRPFYGSLIEGIAPGCPDVAQYAFAFAVGLRFPSATDTD